jgi:histidine triad (HIT) family protein
MAWRAAGPLRLCVEGSTAFATIYVGGSGRLAQVNIEGMAECLFCSIVSGKVPADRVLETPRTIAFRDINPQAPVHVLVIPKQHLADLSALAGAGGGLLDEVAAQAREVAIATGVADSGYRVVFNTGAQAGQTVAHAHAHVLGGRPLAWPPG